MVPVSSFSLQLARVTLYGRTAATRTKGGLVVSKGNPLSGLTIQPTPGFIAYIADMVRISTSIWQKSEFNLIFDVAQQARRMLSGDSSYTNGGLGPYTEVDYDHDFEIYKHYLMTIWDEPAGHEIRSAWAKNVFPSLGSQSATRTLSTSSMQNTQQRNTPVASVEEMVARSRLAQVQQPAIPRRLDGQEARYRCQSIQPDPVSHPVHPLILPTVVPSSQDPNNDSFAPPAFAATFYDRTVSDQPDSVVGSDEGSDDDGGYVEWDEDNGVLIERSIEKSCSPFDLSYSDPIIVEEDEPVIQNQMSRLSLSNQASSGSTHVSHGEFNDFTSFNRDLATVVATSSPPSRPLAPPALLINNRSKTSNALRSLPSPVAQAPTTHFDPFSLSQGRSSTRQPSMSMLGNPRPGMDASQPARAHAETNHPLPTPAQSMSNPAPVLPQPRPRPKPRRVVPPAQPQTLTQAASTKAAAGSAPAAALLSTLPTSIGAQSVDLLTANVQPQPRLRRVVPAAAAPGPLPAVRVAVAAASSGAAGAPAQLALASEATYPGPAPAVQALPRRRTTRATAAGINDRVAQCSTTPNTQSKDQAGSADAGAALEHQAVQPDEPNRVDTSRNAPRVGSSSRGGRKKRN